MSDLAPKEAIQNIQGLEGIGALIKTQTDMERINRMIGADPGAFSGSTLN
jgi:hypothetical protein